MTHLDVSNFFEDVDGKFDNLIGDGNVHTNYLSFIILWHCNKYLICFIYV